MTSDLIGLSDTSRTNKKQIIVIGNGRETDLK